MIWTNERIQPLMAEFFCFIKELCTIPNNGLALGAGGDFGAQNCQYTIPKAFGIEDR